VSVTVGVIGSERLGSLTLGRGGVDRYPAVEGHPERVGAPLNTRLGAAPPAVMTTTMTRPRLLEIVRTNP
jgi:hypothetical protein